MNEPDPLAAELAAMRPREPSSHLRQRIAEELTVTASTEVHSRSRQVWWNGAIAGGIVAACLIAGWLLVRQLPRNNIETAPTVQSQFDANVTFDDTRPTVWSYQRALAHSPQDLEALLDKHASVSPSHVRAIPRHLFIHSDAQFLIQGDL
jgi:hypothetical protein